MTVRRIISSFIDCTSECGQSEFHRWMITLLIERGAVFYQNAPYPPPLNDDPYFPIKENGDLYVTIDFSHHLLNADSEEATVRRGFLASYGNAAIRKSFYIDSLGWRDETENFGRNIQQLAEGRVAFMRFLIPEVKPQLAYADDVWGTNISKSQVENGRTPRLYWTTYFGPRFVEVHGRDFLMNTPAWKTEELEGGVLVTVTEKFLDFVTSEPKECLKYLRQNFKGMRANRFKIHAAF